MLPPARRVRLHVREEIYSPAISAISDVPSRLTVAAFVAYAPYLARARGTLHPVQSGRLIVRITSSGWRPICSDGLFCAGGGGGAARGRSDGRTGGRPDSCSWSTVCHGKTVGVSRTDAHHRSHNDAATNARPDAAIAGNASNRVDLLAERIRSQRKPVGTDCAQSRRPAGPPLRDPTSLGQPRSAPASPVVSPISPGR